MVSRIKQYLVLIISIVGISSAQAQFGLSGGTCLLKGFGTAKPFVGLHKYYIRGGNQYEYYCTKYSNHYL
jgi:hypothetical protein